MQGKENFKSRIGFILVSAGCAIGLGNVWKFPYTCGANGGALFILIYLLFLLFLGLPIIFIYLKGYYDLFAHMGAGISNSMYAIAIALLSWVLYPAFKK